MLAPKHNLIIAHLSVDDLDAISPIQRACYRDDLIESPESFRAKLSATPDTCFGLKENGKLCAYLIALPCTSTKPPGLNSSEYSVPDNADALYIHDLAVLPEARKLGAGKILMEEALKKAESIGLTKSCLFAVQNSKTYWERYGYREVIEPAPQVLEKLRTYGEDTVFMIMELSQPGHSETALPTDATLPGI